MLSFALQQTMPPQDCLRNAKVIFIFVLLTKFVCCTVLVGGFKFGAS
jgi:hypothetical protein